MRRGDDVVEGQDVELEFQRRERCRRSKNETPTKQAIPQHRRVKWESRREMKVIQGKAMPLLTNAELDCMGGDFAWEDYRKSPPQLVRMWMLQKKLMGDTSRSSRGGGMLMLRKQDLKSTREIVKELARKTQRCKRRPKKPRKR